MSKLFKQKTELTIAALFVFFYYGLGYMVSYQPDVYYSINEPEKLISAYNSEGRYIVSLLYRLMRWPGSSFATFHVISFVVSLCSFCCVNVYFAKMIERLVQNYYDNHNIRQTIFICIVSCLTIGNMFSAEYFLYPYSTVGVILDIFLCLVAADRFGNFIDSGYLAIHFFIALLLLEMAAFIYEPVLAVFVIMAALFAVIRSETFKSFVVSQMWCAALYGLAVGSKFVFTRFVLNASRAQIGHSSLSDTIQKYTPQGKAPEVYILDRITFGMWTFALVSLLFFIILTIRLLKNHGRINLLKLIYSLLVVVIMGLLPYILRVSGNFKPRIYYPLGFLFGIMIIYAMSTGFLDDDKKSNNRGVFLYILIGILCVSQWLSFAQMFTDQYITNYDDKCISEMIGECIDEYEEETDQKVKFVSFYSDKERTKYIRNNGWCITQRAYDATWSKLPVLNFYLERSYEQGETDDDIARYFIDRDWNTFSSEQVIIRGDTAHICTF